mgnify:CR=1 FL=1
MKFIYRHKYLVRLILLLLTLGGILIFIYFQLKNDTQLNLLDLKNMRFDGSGNDTRDFINDINESGGIKLQQMAVEGAIDSNDKITLNEVAKIHELNND